MRLIFVAITTLALFAQTPTSAQNCETLSVRDAAGFVTGTKQICVDENGAWVDPATVNPNSEPVQQIFERSEQSIVTIEPRPLTTIAEPVPLVEAEVFPTTGVWEQPVLTAPQPVPLAPTSTYELSRGAKIVEPGIQQSSSKPSAWQPTSGTTKRQQLYAKLGLVCVAQDARYCTNGDCSGLCSGRHGWCDGKTGEVYPSLEAIERVYCRKKKRR